jgi:hypothetical protein
MKSSIVYIVAYLLKARKVEAEKQPLLCNGCVTHNNEDLFKLCFLWCPCRGNITRPSCHYGGVLHVEAGSNTYTVTLRVVGGDEKESLKSETAKYGRESQGTRTRERLRWQGPAAYTKLWFPPNKLHDVNPVVA